MLFGLCNISTTFQRMINKIFYDILDKEVIAFINNILIYKNSINQKHEVFIGKVLDCLLKYRLCIVVDIHKFSVSKLA